MTIIYKVEKDCDEEALNKFGKDGWDLVSVSGFVNDAKGEFVQLFYFKQILNYN